MALVKDKHNTLFKSLTTELLTDLGGEVTIYLENDFFDCEWCIWDSRTKRSTGRPSSGFTWSSHPNYLNTLTCPNCRGVGKIRTYSTVTITKSQIEDISGERYVKGKLAYFPEGTKRIIGLISDVEVGEDNYLEKAKKITIDDEDYTLFAYERLGIKDNHLFRAIVERTEIIEM